MIRTERNGSCVCVELEGEMDHCSARIMKETIEKAIELFNTTTMSVNEVALFLGFADPLYFSRFFKKSIGMSPQKYIKSIPCNSMPAGANFKDEKNQLVEIQ